MRQHLRGRPAQPGPVRAEALELDLSLLPRFERVFGPDHHRTLNVRNNIAADYRRLGRLQDALDEDRKTLRDRRRILGPDDPITLTSLDAVARDLRDLGHYQESLDTARKVVEGFAARRGPENLDWLNARKSFAAALRKAGYHWDALQESEEVVQRYRDYLGLGSHVHASGRRQLDQRPAGGGRTRPRRGTGPGGPGPVPGRRLPDRPGLRDAGQRGIRAARGGRVR